MAKTKRKYVKKDPTYWEKLSVRMKENSPLKNAKRSGRKPLPSLFNLESGIEVPARTRLTEVRKTVRSLLSKMKINQSFVVPKGSIGTVRKVAKEEFPRKRLLAATITPGKNLIRVFRVK